MCACVRECVGVSVCTGVSEFGVSVSVSGGARLKR